MLKTEELFDLSHTKAGGFLGECEYPWQVLPELKSLIISIGKTLDMNEYELREENIFIHRSAIIAPTAFIGSPCIIGKNSEVRHCAFIRGSALTGDGCVIGNSTEIKNSVLFDGVQVPHYNYIGDSILGYKSHMGAGAVTSNVKNDKSLVCIKNGSENVGTGLRKFGAVIGDGAEIGCGSVLNPGTVIGKNASIYPLSCIRGVIPPDTIYKTGGIITERRRIYG